MSPEITPDYLRNAEFRTSFRGLDPAQVAEVLSAAAARLEQMDVERRKLAARLEESPRPDLDSELETVGRDITAILQSAREAAESMRERASVDAARWRSEAMQEAETTRKEAAADAEALRRDAWVTGSELLEQSDANAEAMRAAAERDVLTVMGEAEREAHRLTSGARREAEDVVRTATMEAEQIANEAVKRRDEIIDAANRQSAASQERTRALEQRRDELLEELENVRSTLTRLEGSLEERREALDLTSAEPSSVRVVHPPSDAKEQWQLGETVRVVPPDDQGPAEPDPEIADQVSDEVSKVREPEPDPGPPTSPEPDPVPASTPEPDPVPASTPEPDPVPATTPEPDPDPVPAPTPKLESKPEPVSLQPPAEPDEPNDLDALFASLRSGDATEREPEAPLSTETEPESASADSPVAEDASSTDWIEVRESRLLPITNRALRGIKKSMTEVQNVALDSLRTDEDWRPDPDSIAESVHAEIVAVWSESFAAGHSVAEEMTGSKLKRPPTPASSSDKEFGADLAGAVSTALDGAGSGSREQQSAASRVFRVWRSDEAERRVRDIALRAYEAGLETTRSVSTS